jgi:hypothetical protein
MFIRALTLFGAAVVGPILLKLIVEPDPRGWLRSLRSRRW